MADIYRWVDSRGVVNYTQQKPHNIPSVLVSKGQAKLGSRQAVNSSAASANTSDVTRETANPDQRRQALNEAQQRKLAELKKAEASKAAELVANQKTNCTRAQSALEQLTSNTRIRIRGDDGNVRAIPEEERLSRIEKTQLTIAENCVSS